MQDLILFYPENHEKHAHADHPERPERVEAIRQTLEAAGLWDSSALLPPTKIPEEVLYAIHERQHITHLKEASQHQGQLDADTYIGPDSWQLALNAAGGGLAVAEAVWTGQARRGFSLGRPPGHHATSSRAMGFCLLNNAALTAEYLLQKYDARRIAIIDIDLHHGNGTQNIFYQRDDVFFCSIHQYPLYPMTGLVNETGRGPGEHHTLNFPFPPYAGDKARKAAFDTVLRPLLEDFQPAMLLVSAGFDAHWRDPLGHQLVTAQGYGQFAADISQFADSHCQGRIAFLLEGGYDIQGCASSALATTQGMLGLEIEDQAGPATMDEDPFWESRLEKVANEWEI